MLIIVSYHQIFLGFNSLPENCTAEADSTSATICRRRERSGSSTSNDAQSLFAGPALRSATATTFDGQYDVHHDRCRWIGRRSLCWPSNITRWLSGSRQRIQFIFVEFSRCRIDARPCRSWFYRDRSQQFGRLQQQRRRIGTQRQCTQSPFVVIVVVQRRQSQYKRRPGRSRYESNSPLQSRKALNITTRYLGLFVVVVVSFNLALFDLGQSSRQTRKMGKRLKCNNDDG